MSIEKVKQDIHINKLITNKKEEITVYQDVIVPDSKPDILNTINTTATVCIKNKNAQDDKLNVCGQVCLNIIYLADNPNDNIRGISSKMDFDEMIAVQGIRKNMDIYIVTRIKNIETKVLNGRKINVKAVLELNITAYHEEDEQVVTKIMGDRDIQVLEESTNISTLVGSGREVLHTKEAIRSSNEDEISEILNFSIDIQDRDEKVSYNKILTKADASVEVMYLSEEGKIGVINTKVPIISFIEIPNIQETDICRTNYEINNIELRLDNEDERAINLELETEISCNVYKEENISVIEDLYSPFSNIIFEEDRMEVISDLSSDRRKFSVKEKVKIDELEKGNLLNVQIEPKVSSYQRNNGKVLVQIDLDAKYIFTRNESNVLDIKKIKIPVEYTLDNLDLRSDEEIGLEVEVINKEIIVNDAEVTNLIDLNLLSERYRVKNINSIDEIREEEREDFEDYSVVIYVIKKGDTLWNIAKQFGTTVDDIVRINRIENKDKIYADEKIYIPKYTRSVTVKNG